MPRRMSRVHRHLVNLFLAERQRAQPEHHGPGLRRGLEKVQTLVEHAVPRRRRIDDSQLAQVSVNASGEGQFQNDRAAQN